MKNIKKLSFSDAELILEFVYPNKGYFVQEIAFESKVNPDGSVQVTMNMEPIIGILYHNGQDRCVLPFNDTRVVLWLYDNGYDIKEQLEKNKSHSEQLYDFDELSFAIHQLAKGDEVFHEGYKHNWTLDYVKKTCAEVLEKYYYKEYQ